MLLALLMLSDHGLFQDFRFADMKLPISDFRRSGALFLLGYH